MSSSNRAAYTIPQREAPRFPPRQPNFRERWSFSVGIGKPGKIHRHRRHRLRGFLRSFSCLQVLLQASTCLSIETQTSNSSFPFCTALLRSCCVSLLWRNQHLLGTVISSTPHPSRSTPRKKMSYQQGYGGQGYGRK